MNTQETLKQLAIDATFEIACREAPKLFIATASEKRLKACGCAACTFVLRARGIIKRIDAFEDGAELRG